MPLPQDHRNKMQYIKWPPCSRYLLSGVNQLLNKTSAPLYYISVSTTACHLSLSKCLCIFYQVHFNSPPSTTRFSKWFFPPGTAVCKFSICATCHHRFNKIRGLYNIL